MRETIRHTLATLAYPTAGTLRYAPAGFPHVELGHGVRTPLAILAHMADRVAFTVARLEDRAPEGRSRPGSRAGKGERFHRAEIEVGRVGPDQALP